MPRNAIWMLNGVNISLVGRHLAAICSGSKYFSAIGMLFISFVNRMSM